MWDWKIIAIVQWDKLLPEEPWLETLGVNFELLRVMTSPPAFTSSKSTTETTQQCVKSAQNQQKIHQNNFRNIVLVNLWLTLNRSHTITWFFYCWLLSSSKWESPPAFFVGPPPPPLSYLDPRLLLFQVLFCRYFRDCSDGLFFLRNCKQLSLNSFNQLSVLIPS